MFYSDLVSKEILANNEAVRLAVSKRFGEAAYNSEGPDRAFLASVVFNDIEALEDLNAILHPKVGARFQEWCTVQQTPYVIKEAAILFESGANRGLDAIVVVGAPDEVRVQRVMERDGISRNAVLERMQKQMPQEKKIALGDHEVTNDGSSSLIERVKELDAFFRRSAA